MRTTTDVPPRRPLAAFTAALAALAIASLGLAACGGSSGSSSSGPSGSNTATGNAAVRNTATGNTAVRNAAAAKALRAFRQHARVAKSVPPATRPGLKSPGAVRFRQALSKFAACLRQNGVNLPAPNTAGHGPMFSTKGVNTASPQFRAATAKCRTTLTSALRGRP